MPHHNVYVVLLRDDVWRVPRFADANPHYIYNRPCVYVGMTGLTPRDRFWRHRRGQQACWLVRDFGHRLMPELYEHLNPMTCQDAARMERELAEQLRAEGYAVWQH